MREKALRLGAASPTAAHADAFAQRRRSLAEVDSAFPLAPWQSGALLALGADMLCLDYVSRPDAFARLYPKLLAGYALDALERLDRPAAAVEAFEGLLGDAAAASVRRRRSEGLGDDLRSTGRGVLGSGLELDEELIRLSVFTENGADWRGRSRGRAGEADSARRSAADPTSAAPPRTAPQLLPWQILA